MWTTDDGVVVDSEGKVIFFTTERFINDICLGDCCFICGAQPGDVEFNDEHILPDWLLRHFDLFSKEITLPNGATSRYGSYKIPCCYSCNSMLGKVIEHPISNVIQGGVDAINDFVKRDLLKMFVWMGLIFLKTHLKDRKFRFHLDERKGNEKISDPYMWKDLHHIHSVVRCYFSGCLVEPEAIGSFLSLPVTAQISQGRFDFGDLYQAQTMMLRLDDVALLTVFNDSGASMSRYWDKLKKITGPLSEIQLYEVMIELAWLNIHLKERTEFYTQVDLIGERCRIIGVRPPTIDLKEMDYKLRGKIMHHLLSKFLPHMEIAGLTEQETIEAIDSGKFTFLFDDDGNFIRKSLMVAD